MFWGGVEAGKKALETVVAKTSQSLDSASQVIQPSLQRATTNVTSATSEIFE